MTKWTWQTCCLDRLSKKMTTTTISWKTMRTSRSNLQRMKSKLTVRCCTGMTWSWVWIPLGFSKAFASFLKDAHPWGTFQGHSIKLWFEFSFISGQIRTRDSWVVSANAISVLCRPWYAFFFFFRFFQKSSRETSCDLNQVQQRGARLSVMWSYLNRNVH